MLAYPLQSSWLRDALSELDSSCEKVTFIGTPSPDGPTRARRLATPSFRIRAKGMFGSTEVGYVVQSVLSWDTNIYA
jgi:cell cycle checkpoint protein